MFKITKKEIIIILGVLFLFAAAFFFGVYKLGQMSGIKKTQDEIQVLRVLNTQHLEKIDSLEIEILKMDRIQNQPVEVKKEILSKKWTKEELPKFQNNCREWKLKNPNKKITSLSPCSMLKMIESQQEYIKKGLKNE